ncbi:MAG: chemotaxis protein CheR [Alphaproteobacteria bacterium]|nr:MAG: chemotaxis protein CheR [Alphaproteobacteria bacterium]
MTVQDSRERMAEASQDYAPPLHRETFLQLAGRIREVAGIVLRDNKISMVQARLAPRLRELELPGYEAYLDYLSGPGGEAEKSKFVSALTTNLTGFFREAHHFAHLEKDVIGPALAAGAPRFRLWSAGCSSGEEPYTIQMVMARAGGLKASWDYLLLATDIDEKILDRARNGVYDAERCEAIPDPLRERYMESLPGDRLKVRPDLRQAIRFRRLNLMESFPFKGPFDAIFCRNVLIYFNAETKKRIVERFTACLGPRRFLYLGHSESLLGAHPDLELVGRTIYQKRT